MEKVKTIFESEDGKLWHKKKQSRKIVNFLFEDEDGKLWHKKQKSKHVIYKEKDKEK